MARFCRLTCSRREQQAVLHRSWKKRQRFAARPRLKARPIVWRERMTALPARNMQITLRLVSRRYRKALRGTKSAPVHVLHARHVVIAGQLKGRHVEKAREV